MESPINEILLSSTGDGYVVAFSEQDKDLDALEMLVEMYNKLTRTTRSIWGLIKEIIMSLWT